MFAVSNIFRISTPLTRCIRNVRRESYVPRGRRFAAAGARKNFGPNPGVDQQLSVIDYDKQEIKDAEFLDDMEKSFWDADKLHNIYESEKKHAKEKLSLYQVARKDFNEEKSPNMLFWEEKEEIRSLHHQDSDKWSVTQLAHSFPASPDIIQKILKSTWKPKSHDNIQRHDKKVEKNWAALLTGSLDIANEELKNHYLSFTMRRKPVSSAEKDVAVVNEIPAEKKTGAFTNIYRSYKNNKPHTEDADTSETGRSSIDKALSSMGYPVESDTFVIPKHVQSAKHYTRKEMTMEAMQKSIIEKHKLSQSPQKDDEYFAAAYKERCKDTKYKPFQDPIGKIAEDPENNNSHNVNNNTVSDIHKPYQNDTEQYQLQASPTQTHKLSKGRISKCDHKMSNEVRSKAIDDFISKVDESYPLSIEIPKGVMKEGAMYRVNDCFYTDDGEFLYRVPGLLKR